MTDASPKHWLELSLEIEREHAEAVETALQSLGASAVTLLDNANQDLLEPGVGETPLWASMRIVGLFEAHYQQQTILDQLEQDLGKLPPHQCSLLDDRDWERVWLDDFAPQRFGQRLWICPSWQSVDEEHAVVVKLDPGLAFGTGTHATTAMCLQWLDGADVSGRTVIDFGCGSGILAIAALALGAEKVIAIDNDPQALQATRSNAANNQIPDTQLQTYPPDELPKHELAGSADILIANILAGPLLALAPTLLSLLRSNGQLVLSGILREQCPALMDCYGTTVRLNPPQYQAQWARLDGTKNEL